MSKTTNLQKGVFMSDYIVKIVPRDPICKVAEQRLMEAKHFIESKLSCDSVTIEFYEFPQFIDCGGNLERILCPLCGAVLDMNWWSNAVSRAYENHFRVLETVLPCCGQTASLNDLKYDFQCAFASCAILIMNPWSIVEEVIAHVQEVLGSEITVIHALY